jgi:sialic acid synthase
MIHTAAICGAQAAKLQKRQNETLYSVALLNAPYENEHSFGKTYGQHRQALELKAQDYLGLRVVAKTAKMAFFATAFDEASVDFLLQVDVPAIKIASGGLCDEALLAYAASTAVPIILSTGGGTFDDVDRAVNILAAGKSPFALLHCTAAYPVRTYSELNLLAIVEMRQRYPDVVVGWSGHDPGISMALVAYGFGASIIEKHFTLNRANKGTDHAFSLEPKGLSTLCEDLKRAYEAKGDGIKRFYESERVPLSKMRRRETPMGLRITGQMYVEH